MLETGTFNELQVFGNAYVGGELVVSEVDVVTDVYVAGVASCNTLLVSQSIFSPCFVAEENMFIYGDVEFAGKVEGLPGPKHHAARVLASGQVAYNSGGFSSIGVTTAGDNVYEYVFNEPLMGAEYSVVATSNFNEGNIHCNVTNLNSFGFTIETGRNSNKPAKCGHSVQVTYN